MEKEQLKNRLKSFLWRLGSMVAVASFTFLAQNLGLFGLSPEVQVLLGLFLGEVTKALNTQ